MPSYQFYSNPEDLFDKKRRERITLGESLYSAEDAAQDAWIRQRIYENVYSTNSRQNFSRNVTEGNDMVRRMTVREEIIFANRERAAMLREKYNRPYRGRIANLVSNIEVKHAGLPRRPPQYEGVRRGILDARRQAAFAKAAAARGEGFDFQFMTGQTVPDSLTEYKINKALRYDKEQQDLYKSSHPSRRFAESYKSRQTRRVQKQYGFYGTDPRLDIASKFGLVKNRANLGIDIESVMAGPGTTPYHIGFAFSGTEKFAEAYIPLETIYRSEVVAAINKQAQGLEYDIAMTTPEGLKRRFQADFMATRRSMGQGKQEAERELARIFAAYDNMYREASSVGAIFDPTTGDADYQMYKQLEKTGVLNLFSDKRGINVIGHNVKYDVGLLTDTLRRASGSLKGVFKHTQGRNRTNAIIAKATFDDIQNAIKGVPIQTLPDKIGGKSTWGVQRTGATYFDTTALTTSSDWRSFMRREKIRPLNDLQAELRKEGRSLPADKAALLQKYKQINRRAATLTETADILDVAVGGEAHGALADVITNERIRQKVSTMTRVTKEGKTVPTFSSFANMTGSQMFETMAQGQSRIDEGRLALSARANKFISEAGGIATLRSGRLSGMQVKNLSYRGKGRFVVAMGGNQGGAFSPRAQITKELSDKIEKAYAATKGRNFKAVKNAIDTQFFSSPANLDALVKVYSNHRGSSIADVLKKVSEFQSPQRYMNQVINSGQELAKISLEGKSTVEAASLQLKTAMDNAKAVFAKSIGYVPSAMTDTDAERMLSRYAGAIRPIEDLRKHLRTTVRARLGVGKGSSALAVRLSDILIDDLTLKTMFAAMETAPGDVGGMGILSSGMEGSSLSAQIARQRKLLDESGYNLENIVENAITSEGTISSAKEMEEIRALKNSILYTGEGYSHSYPIHVKELQEALAMVSPSQTFAFGLDPYALDSAGSELDRVVRIGSLKGLTSEMARGAIEGSTREKGIWHIAQALRQQGGALPILSGGNKQEIGKLMELISNWQGGGGNLEKMIRESRININESDISYMVGAMQEMTGDKYSVNKVINELVKQNPLSTDYVVAWGGMSGEGIETFGSRIPDIKAFEEFSRVEDRMVAEGLRTIEYKGRMVSPETLGTERAYEILMADENLALFKKHTDTFLGAGSGDVAVRMRDYLATSAGRLHFTLLARANEELTELGRATKETSKPELEGFFRATMRHLYIPKDLKGKRITDLNDFTGMPSGIWKNVRTGTEKSRMFVPYENETIINRINYMESLINEQFSLGPNAYLKPDLEGILGELQRVGLEGSGTWKVPGSLFGINKELVEAEAMAYPDLALTSSSGEALENAHILTRKGTQPIAVGMVHGDTDFTVATHAGLSERDIGYVKSLGMGELFGAEEPTVKRVGWSELGPEIDALIARKKAQGDLIGEISLAERQHRIRMATAAAEESGMLAAGLSETRKTMRSIGTAIKEVPAHWKILAAGVAGAAAITMMRKNRPITQEDSMAYGGFPGGSAYPMGAMPVGQQSTYMAPPAVGGMRASIAGVVGPDVSVANLQSMVGNLGFANISVSDNSRTISQRDINQMISSRL